MMINLAGMIFRMLVSLLKKLMIVMLLALKLFLSAVKLALLLVGLTLKLFLTVLKVGIPK